jgi:glutaredoxin-like YruB-family protein
MVKVYSTPTCVYCETLKEYLGGKKIDFESIDVSQNQKELNEMIDKSGQMGVPVIDINGTIVVGFDKEKINSLLNIKE